MRALTLLVLLAYAGMARASVPAEIMGTASSLARCYRRCERNNPPLPSPAPTASPKPIPCEPIGTKTYADGEEKMLCFDVGGTGASLVQVQSQNHGNASCAFMQMTCTSPTGETYYSEGVQPGCPLFRKDGRFYVWTKLLTAAPDVCHTYTFTVLK